jgi:hypothetical protein
MISIFRLGKNAVPEADNVALDQDVTTGPQDARDYRGNDNFP